MNLKKTLLDFEDRIRQGQGQSVKKILKTEIPLNQVPRSQYQALANVAIRVGLPTLAIKLLGREIHQAPSFERSSLNTAERAEYASALTAIGAYPEAHRILKTLNPREYPAVWLYDAFSLFNQWRYGDAIPGIENYLRHTEDPYRARVGRVNLCAALVFCQDYARALDELQKLRAELEPLGLKFLLGNTLELMAQCYLGLKKFKSCDQVLRASQQLLSQTGSFSYLFTQKWNAISHLAQDKPQGRDLLTEVRALASSLGHFETLRECDWNEGLWTQNAHLVTKVYFGTPYSSYREKIASQAGSLLNIFQPMFDLDVTSQPQDLHGLPPAHLRSKSLKTTWNVSAPLSGATENSHLHNLQKILFSDFYAHWRIGTLFSHLFQDEHYDYQSSPNRIYQLIHRWNELAAAAPLPVRIQSDGTGFHAVALQQMKWRIPLQAQVLTRMDSQILILKSHFGSREFRAAEAQELLGRSQSRTSELLTQALQHGLSKNGAGRSTFYKFSA